MKAGVLVALFLILCMGAPPATWGRNPDTPVAYITLQQDLVRHGLDKDYVAKVFRDSRVEFLPKVVTKITYLKKERPADYSHFLKPEVVEKGRRFLQSHRPPLLRAQHQYGVAPEVIVAILTVESDLGKVTGRYSVFNVFASLAVMDTPEVIQALDLNRGMMPRLKKKAAWGKSELCAFLSYCRQNRVDPFSIQGSWAGAFGFAQFLPSSLLRCGADGNRDGCVDLFCYDDAIFSIANYLHRSGFKMSSRSTWSKAVHAYNHSDAYVDTVLTLANWY